MPLLVIDPAATGLGTVGPSLDARSLAVTVSRDVPADVADVQGLLVLGRPATPADHDALEQLIRHARTTELPVLALGDGAEVAASALGGEVAPREGPEIGLPAIHRTVPGRDDDIAAGWPDGARALTLHDHEVVLLPTDAEQLLLGSDGPSMWRSGSVRACPLLLHVGPDELAALLDQDERRALLAAASVDHDELMDEARRLAPYTRAAGMSLILRWVDGLPA